jgi:hypothetical protein
MVQYTYIATTKPQIPRLSIALVQEQQAREERRT